MKKFEFNYSKDFKCVASACKHSCCVGWKIFIDKKTRENYSKLEPNDQRFKGTLSDNGEMVLTKDLSCPFLDKDNLCHIIKNYGEKSISKTCKTHPRFINFFSSFTETGLGLYCEEACRIILSSKAKMKPVLKKDSATSKPLTSLEKKILAFRKKTLSIVQNRELSILERVSRLEELSKINLSKKSFSEWLTLFNGLEKIPSNADYFIKLNTVKDFSIEYNLDYATIFEQILAYLAYRHISRAIDEIDLEVRLAFCVLSFKMIYELFAVLCSEQTALIEACRFYTSTVELSDDNLFLVLNEIEKLVVLL